EQAHRPLHRLGAGVGLGTSRAHRAYDALRGRSESRGVVPYSVARVSHSEEMPKVAVGSKGGGMASGKRMTKRGNLTLDELAAEVESGGIDTVQVVFPDCYGRFMGKRVPGAFFLKSVAEHGMHACNYLLTVDMEMDVVAGYDYASWQQGYGDFHCVP